MAKKPKRFRYRYYAVVDGQDGAWGAVVPDFPGCHGGGATLEDAIKDVTSALREFASAMELDGEALPAPTDLDTIVKEREAAGEPYEIIYCIPLVLSGGRMVRANISLDARTLRAID